MTRQYVIHENGDGPEFRGAALDLWKYKGQEVILSGPAETGKTFACLHKLHALLLKYPKSQAVMVRKVRDTIRSTCLQTLTRKVFQQNGEGGYVGATAYGGENPQWFDFPNGSRLWLAGIDDPGKALSSERDFIYVNQAEELSADDWQVLTTRATGRAGNTPYSQVFGDCNPGPPYHWIKNRPSLKLLESRHEDNPTLWDIAKSDWTEQGRRTLAILDNLTGVRLLRLRKGLWVSAEGVVYDGFDPRVHVIDRYPIPRGWTLFRVIDFGHTNPFVCLWLALDPDGRIYLYRELYMTQRTVRVHAQQIKERSTGEKYSATICDHDAEDRATLAENGIHNIAADKRVTPGIQAVQERLKPAGDGRARLFLMRDVLIERDETKAALREPVCCEQEFGAYEWPKSASGRPVKEEPVKKYDHALDALRYGVMWADARLRGGNLDSRRAVPDSAVCAAARAPAGVFAE